MSNYPKWATTPRQTALVRLFVESKGFCVFRHPHCPYPEHYYENYIEDLIKYWISEDRIDRYIEWQLEQQALHKTNQRYYPIRGQFSGVSKDIFEENQPEYYILAFGISGLTLKPFAKVRLASSYMVLWVELDKLTYARISKSKKRKAIRYQKRIRHIDRRIIEAVKHYKAE